MTKVDFCTCGDKKCPLNPVNHDEGCSLCIRKNLALREIPTCFFKLFGEKERADYSIEAFAKEALNQNT